MGGLEVFGLISRSTLGAGFWPLEVVKVIIEVGNERVIDGVFALAAGCLALLAILRGVHGVL